MAKRDYYDVLGVEKSAGPDQIKAAYFDVIRDAVDRLEGLIDDEDWPLLKYREMLFLR